MSGSPKILEAVLPQVTQGHIVWQVLLHEVAGCLGEQHLSTMRGAHDARGAMHVHANIPLGCQRRFACVQTNTDTHYYAFGPGMSGKGALRVHRSQYSIRGARKSHKEGIALRIHLVATPLLKCSTQQGPAPCQ